MKTENKDSFSTSKAIKQIISDLRVTRQKTTQITPFEAHFGRLVNTPLRNISTCPSSLNLTYEKIIIHYLDADTVPVDKSSMMLDGSILREAIWKLRQQ